MDRPDDKTILWASEISYEEDSIMILGKNSIGEWVVAHNDDFGKQANMTDTYRIDASGIRDD